MRRRFALDNVLRLRHCLKSLPNLNCQRTLLIISNLLLILFLRRQMGRRGNRCCLLRFTARPSGLLFWPPRVFSLRLPRPHVLHITTTTPAHICLPLLSLQSSIHHSCHLCRTQRWIRWLALSLVRPRQLRPAVLQMIVRFHLDAAFGTLWHSCLCWLLGFRFLLRHYHHFRHVYLLVQQGSRSSERSVSFDVVRRKGVVYLTLVAA